jgi:colanic acid biosynthesis glycosyl transferase WcaI
MHILIISQYFWPESFRINDLALALQAQGHRITVLTGMPCYPHRQNFQGYGKFSPSKENYQGITILRVPMLSRGEGNNKRLLLNYASFVLSAGILGPLRCRDKYDMIFVFQPSPISSVLPAILLRKLKRIPLMLWVQDLWPETLRATEIVRSETLLAFVNKLVKFIYKRCDSILIQAKTARTSIASFEIPATKINYFPNWAEAVYQVKPPDLTLKASLNLPDGFWIMFAGNLGVSQSLETILLAAQNLQTYADIHFVIVGDGRQSNWLQEQIAQRNLSNIHMIGRKPVEQMADLFALADVLLMTLKRDPIFSMVIPSKLQSYLACAKPVVAAIDGEGAQIILESGAGLVGPSEDALALANNLLSLYHMTPEQRKEMGANAHKYYQQHFNRDNLLNNLENWMKQLKRN